MQTKYKGKTMSVTMLALMGLTVYLLSVSSPEAYSGVGRPDGFPPAQQISTDIYVNIGNIKGESNDDRHKEWIEAQWIDYGMSQPAGQSSSSGGARSGTRIDFSEFTIGKIIDKTSPTLYLYSCNGKHIQDVYVELCKAGGSKTPYMKYHMQDVIISSIGPVTVERTKQMEQVSLRFGSIEWEYAPIDRTGKTGATTKSGWNLTQNKQM
jgi:type VI secretion system secreted protein Hcp